MGAPRVAEGGWGHALPKLEASCTPVARVVIGTGALNRRLPRGGSTKGIPKNCSVPLVVNTPWKVPVFRVTSGEVAMTETQKVAESSTQNFRNVGAIVQEWR